ncbi:conserved membrane hypothetical protein [[Clostridium] ultunense Esp]|nr:conserved membrane hypothetical protein [[Clostridium] ultunense Esp]
MQGVPGARIDFNAIFRIILLLLLLYLISALFSYFQQWIMAGVSQRTVYALRKDISEKLSRLPLKFYDSRPHGEILSRVTNDVDMISSTLQQGLTQMIASFISFIGILAMMFLISPLMTLIALFTLPLSVLATAGIAKRSQIQFAGQQKALGELNAHVEEMFTGHLIVKAFGRERRSIETFKKLNENLYDAGWKAQFISGIIWPAISFVNNIGYVLVSVLGGILVMRRAIEIGDVQAFISYMRQFSQPIIQAANIANVIQATIASAERVFELLDEEEEVPEEKDVRPAEGGEVTFEHVTFGYNRENPVIEDFNLTVSPGKRIAIVGPTGAGKTTLVNLLLRFYDVDQGRIAIDGVDIREMKRENLRRLFGMVLQDTWLFHGTIRENIAYGRENATEEEIIHAAKLAHADSFIRSLPEGYDTLLNEEASNLSQGEKQLLTIARAFLANPPILILDEATSNVDPRTELLIQRGMDFLMKGRTSFVIAHRLSTIREADLILVMNHGRIVEQGTHRELLAQRGFYADLYESQFSSPDPKKRVISSLSLSTSTDAGFSG